jgi:hypothetical protein
MELGCLILHKEVGRCENFKLIFLMTCRLSEPMNLRFESDIVVLSCILYLLH